MNSPDGNSVTDLHNIAVPTDRNLRGIGVAVEFERETRAMPNLTHPNRRETVVQVRLDGECRKASASAESRVTPLWEVSKAKPPFEVGNRCPLLDFSETRGGERSNHL